MAGEWGPWIEHDGKGCPVRGQYAQWVWHDGTLREGLARTKTACGRTGRILGPSGATTRDSWDWSTKPFRRTVRYRVRRPKALQELIELAAAPGTPRRVPCKVP